MLNPDPIAPITYNVDPSDYHKLGSNQKPGDAKKIMSRSELRKFSQNAQRWIRGMDDESTDSMEWGSLIDVAILTPELFEKVYAITPETYMAKGAKKSDPEEEKPWNWNATFCKEWRMAAQKEGKLPVKPAVASEVWKAAKRFDQDEILRSYIATCHTQVQVRVNWTDKATGLVVPIKCLLDLVPSKESEFFRSIGDLKTCCNAQPDAWENAVFREGYYVQAALYLDAYNCAAKEKRIEFYNAIQENFSPYETGRRMMSEEFIELGRVEYQYQLRKYCECLASGTWPGYDDQPENRDVILNGWRLVEPRAWMVIDR